jgi:hypothetical protein
LLQATRRELSAQFPREDDSSQRLNRMRIVVLGYIVRGPIGGLAWHHLQYVLGLKRLGHDVCFIEDSDDYPSCYDPGRHVVDTDPTYGLRFAADAFRRLGLDEQWAYHDAHTAQWLGPARNNAERFCRSADLVLNVSAVNPLRDWTIDVPLRALIDTDPVFTQVRNIRNVASREGALGHNAFFTFAENVERYSAMLPDDGIHWRATRQPVVLDLWQVTHADPSAPFTTVMQWQSYPSLEYAGRVYGTKAESFEAFMELPRLTARPLEIALGGNDAPREMLAKKRWTLRNPLDVAREPADFQAYVRASRGELAIAKQAYVVSNSGWFSERSAAYLASGRPVVTQETGFSEWLPVGDGLFAFPDPAGAVDALERIENDYERCSSTARSIAENFFDSSEVLSTLLERAAKS